MRNKRFFLTLSLIPLFPLHAGASGLTLVETIQRAWNASPALKQQLDAQKDLYDLSRSDRWHRFLLNEPLIQYSNTDNGTAEAFSIAETIAFPGKSLAYSRIDRAQERFQQAEWNARKYEIARDVTAAYLEAAISLSLVDQQKRNIGDLETLQKSLQARYEAGMATQAETLVTELQLRQQKADLVSLEDKAQVAAHYLNGVLNLDPGISPEYALPDDLDEGLISQLGELTADQMRAKASRDLATANATTAFWTQLPDFTVGISRNHYILLAGSPNGEASTRSYSVGMTLPVFFPFNERSEIRRRRALSEIDEKASEVRALNAEKDRQDAIRDYNRSKIRLHDLREKDLPYAEALMDSTFSSYKAGKLGMAELVLARKTLLDLRALDIQLRGEIISSHLRFLRKEGV